MNQNDNDNKNNNSNIIYNIENKADWSIIGIIAAFIFLLITYYI